MVKGLSKEDVQMLGQDIRFIRLGKARLQPMREPFFLSGLYIGLLAAILVLFAGTYIALRKQIRESQNVALDPRQPECGSDPGPASQQSGHSAFQDSQELYGRAQPARLLRRDAEGFMGVYER